MKIHPSAIVEPDVELGQDVEIGAYSVIRGKVKIGDGTRISPSVYMEGHVEIGEGCRLFPFVTLGTPPQDLKYKGEDTRVVIGKDNVLREYVNINCGTAGGGGTTRIGNGNFIMAYSHIAHDSRIGDSTILGNACTLAGHVLIEDFATVGRAVEAKGRGLDVGLGPPRLRRHMTIPHGDSLLPRSGCRGIPAVSGDRHGDSPGPSRGHEPGGGRRDAGHLECLRRPLGPGCGFIARKPGFRSPTSSMKWWSADPSRSSIETRRSALGRPARAPGRGSLQRARQDSNLRPPV